MSNERIDLTQFEGHTEGPWYYEMPPEEGMVIKVSDFCHVAELSFLMSNMSPETDDVNPTGLDPDAVDARLILAAPDLLAELKRCYAKVDALTAALKTIVTDSYDDEVAKYAEQIIQTTSLY